MIKKCKNIGCGKVLVRRPKEADSTFRNVRRFCSRQCGIASHTTPVPERVICLGCKKPIEFPFQPTYQQLTHRKYCSSDCQPRRAQVYPRSCVICHEPMVQRDNEANANFMRRKACSKRCGWLCKSRPIPTERKCKGCGTPLGRRREETPSAYLKRQGCSKSCILRKHPFRKQPCGNCHEEFVTDKPLAKYCSKKCDGEGRRTKQLHERCLVCSSLLKKGDAENYWCFSRRQTCGAECRYINIQNKRLTASPYKLLGVPFLQSDLRQILGVGEKAFRKLRSAYCV